MSSNPFVNNTALSSYHSVTILKHVIFTVLARSLTELPDHRFIIWRFFGTFRQTECFSVSHLQMRYVLHKLYGYSLTDEESRKNWEEYGNPDGPGAMQFGIALPKWLVEGNTSIWVLMSYVVVFMVVLPAVVVSKISGHISVHE